MTTQAWEESKIKTDMYSEHHGHSTLQETTRRQIMFPAALTSPAVGLESSRPRHLLPEQYYSSGKLLGCANGKVLGRQP